MSKKKQIIEVTPPDAIGIAGAATEKIHVCGMPCSYCSGSSDIWGADEKGEDILTPCPVCGGKGTLDATVTIQWHVKNRKQ